MGTQTGLARATESRILRIHIEGIWPLSEMSGFFGFVDKVYCMFLALDKNLIAFQRPATRRSKKQAQVALEYGVKEVREIYVEHMLEVVQLQYSSPGVTDCSGLGKIVEQVKELLVFLLDRRKRALENKAAVLELIDRCFAVSEKRRLTESQKRVLFEWLLFEEPRLSSLIEANLPDGLRRHNPKVTLVEAISAEEE